MRLLRLLSQQPTPGTLAKSEFENYFNDNIILKANSKIGLLNASIPINYKIIQVDVNSNTFQFKSANGHAYHTVVITNQAYTTQSFLDTLNQASWKMLTFGLTSNIGFFIYFTTLKQSGQDTFAISTYRIAPVNIDPDPAKTENVAITIGATMTRQDQVGTNNQAFLYSKLPFLMSCSYLRIQVLNAVRNMIVGITDTFAGTTATDLNDDNLVYAIKIDTTGGGARRYFYRHSNGAYQDTAVASAVNDIIALEIENGRVYYRIYRANPIQLGNFEIDQLRIMHHCVGLRETTVQTSLPVCFYDPRFNVALNDRISYSESVNESIYSDDVITANEDPLGVPPTPPANLNQIIATINFNQDVFRRILGFNRQTLTYKGLRTSFIADVPCNELSIPSNLIVELRTMKLDSYDGFLQGRRNIVAIIPNAVHINNHIIFETPNPVMLDLDNPNDLTIRSMRISILTRDDVEALLDVDDQIELTFLID